MIEQLNNSNRRPAHHPDQLESARPIALDHLLDHLLNHLLHTLGYQGRRPKRYYMCHCPAHDDHTPSLSVATGVNGRILLHCFAGCSTPAVLNALGLTMADLDPRGHRWYHRNQLKFPFYENIHAITPTPFVAVRPAGKHNPNEPPSQPLGKIVARYIYRDANGLPLCQVARFEPKSFRQMRYVNGNWYWGLTGIRPPLYRLPQLLAAPLDEWIFIVEGEKDVETLCRHGLIATCNIGGAGKWRPDYAPSLANRRLCLLPDNDEPGRSHSATIAAHLRGTAAAIRILELPNLPPKGDISDWLEMGGDRDQLLALLK